MNLEFAVDEESDNIGDFNRFGFDTFDFND